MKKILFLLLALLLVVPTAFAAKTNYMGNAIIDDDVTGFVMTAWNDPFDETTANRLIIANAGENAEFPLPDPISDQAMIDYANDAWHWTEENRGFGDFVIAKKLGEDCLRFCFDGTTEDPESTADGAYYDYTSRYYSGAEEGQIKRIYVPEDNRLTAYLMFYCEAAGVHQALRVEWVPDGEGSETGTWHVSNFYRDNVRDYTEMEVCARFNYFDRVGGVEVTTETSNLNVRAWPNGDIIGSLKKGSIITVYRCEEVADNEIPFTLISKWTKPDAEGRSSLEYFGWVASEYLTEGPDWVWVYGD